MRAFLRWPIWPVSGRLGFPHRLVTLSVIRRTMGTNMQNYGALRDTRRALRRASITKTGNVYVQTLDAKVASAVIRGKLRFAKAGLR